MWSKATMVSRPSRTISSCSNRFAPLVISIEFESAEVSDPVTTACASEDEYVGVRSAGQRVPAGAADQEVPAVLPAEGVVAAPSDQSIVTLARYERVAEIGAAHHVVAGKHLALHPARVTEGEGLNIDVEAPCLPISAPRS